MANALELAQEEAPTNEKRICQDHAVKGGVRDEKRPRRTLFSVVMEAVKLDSLQNKILPDLEPLLRRVVKEELDYALSTNFPAIGVETWVLQRRIQELQGPPGNDSRILQLVFKNTLSRTLFTGSKVEAEDGTAIHVQLLDAKTSQLVSEGPEATAKLEIVVLDGDFAPSEDEPSEGFKTCSWEQSEFGHYTLKEREGKPPLLTGDLFVFLKEGEASLGDFQFTDNSSWIRSRTFRLGVKVALGYCNGMRVREAKTNPFVVKDHRVESYKKHYPPALRDEVWRLNKIGKDGAFHKRLSEANIFTVEQFLRFHSMQPDKLRKIIGKGHLCAKMWEVLVNHAETCVFGSRQHIFQHQSGVSIIFNNIFQLVAIKDSDQNAQRAVDSLNHKDKAVVEKVVKELAHANWKDLIHEYDGDRSFDMNPSFQGDSMAGSNAYMQEENQLVPQTYAAHLAASVQPLPDQCHYIMDSGSSLDEFSQPSLLAASCSYLAQMQGYIANGIMASWAPTPSVLTAIIPPPPPCHFALPPEGISGAIASYVHPEATQSPTYQDLPKWSTNCIEGNRRALTREELEVELMHPGNDNMSSETYFQDNMPTYSTTYNSWQDDDNNICAYGFSTTSPCILGEAIPNANSGEQQQRIKPAPPWCSTSKPPRACVRQVQQLEDSSHKDNS